MFQSTKPSKESVRAWLSGVVERKEPPPSPEQVRRELGWGLIAPNKFRSS